MGAWNITKGWIQAVPQLERPRENVQILGFEYRYESNLLGLIKVAWRNVGRAVRGGSAVTNGA